MCEGNPNLPPEAKTAKCICIPVLVLAIISTSSIFMFPAGLLMCVSGILGIVGTSIVICCGPSKPGEGSGKLKCCAILCIIAAVFHLVGLILMIVVYALACAEAETWWRGGCGVYTGWLIIIIIDGLISVGAGVLEVVCAVKCMSASAVLAIPYEGSQVATATGVATNAVVATAVVATAAPPAVVTASVASPVVAAVASPVAQPGAPTAVAVAVPPTYAAAAEA